MCLYSIARRLRQHCSVRQQIRILIQVVSLHNQQTKLVAMSNKNKYKTQGTIASICMEADGTVSFTIEPTEPYDFPVKENGETKKYILLETLHEDTVPGEENKAVNKDSPETILRRLSPTTKFTMTISFETLIAIKQNRSKVEIEIDGKEQKELSADPDSPTTESKSSTSQCEKTDSSAAETNRGYTVIKFTVK